MALVFRETSLEYISNRGMTASVCGSMNAPDVAGPEHTLTKRSLNLTQLIDHYPHYARTLRSIPYAAIRRLINGHCRGYERIEPLVMRTQGLEVGGPSRIFRQSGLIPVYGCCAAMDTCNFSMDTIWSGNENRRSYGCNIKKRYVAEATNLAQIPDASYGFVLASHVLEHIANPLKALKEWKRVLSPGGVVVAILPDKRRTFDHRRPFTSIQHIESDFLNDVSEDDLTHAAEIIELHDLGLDPGAGRSGDFRMRCLDNASIRGMHHHVFSPELLVKLFDRIRMRVLNVTIERPYHLIVCAQRLVTQGEKSTVSQANQDFLGKDADWRLCDPLRCDHS